MVNALNLQLEPNARWSPSMRHPREDGLGGGGAFGQNPDRALRRGLGSRWFSEERENSSHQLGPRRDPRGHLNSCGQSQRQPESL